MSLIFFFLFWFLLWYRFETSGWSLSLVEKNQILLFPDLWSLIISGILNLAYEKKFLPSDRERFDTTSRRIHYWLRIEIGPGSGNQPGSRYFYICKQEEEKSFCKPENVDRSIINVFWCVYMVIRIDKFCVRSWWPYSPLRFGIVSSVCSVYLLERWPYVVIF